MGVVTTRQGVIEKPSVVLDYNKNMEGSTRIMANFIAKSWLENF